MRRYFDFSGKIVLVTGSTRGIGRVVAETFAKQGALVIINSRTEGDVKNTAAIFNTKGYSAEGIAADVGDKNAVRVMFEKIEREFGHVDILVNNAALRPLSPIEAIDDTSWAQVLNVNFLGALHVTQTAVALMKPRRAGSIISISSIAALKLPEYYIGLHYAVSKGALLSFTRSIAKELGPFGIRANAVICGPVDKDTGQEFSLGIKEESFLKRLCTPQEVAWVCLFLASDSSSCITGEYITTGGY